MGWIAIDIRCQDCDHVTDILIDRDEQGGTWGCPECGGAMSKTFSAPNITRASYVDGTKRKGFLSIKKLQNWNQQQRTSLQINEVKLTKQLNG